MAGHKHAALMAIYAADAAEMATPWERWECLGAFGEWERLLHSPGWHTNEHYRRKPRTMVIAGREISRPLRGAIQGQNVYGVGGAGGIFCLKYQGDVEQSQTLRDGRLFATEEDAKAAYDAITELFTGETK